MTMSEVDILLGHNDEYRKLKDAEMTKAREQLERDQKSKTYKKKHVY